MVDAHKDEFARFRAPLRNVEITLIDRSTEDLPLIELRIREGRRITTVELDRDTAGQLAETLTSWSGTAGASGDH